MNPIIAVGRDTTQPAKMATDDSYSVVMAYANGEFAWHGLEIDRFVKAGKHLYRIDVTSAIPYGASILDVERGDATPAMAAGWVRRRNEYRNDACVYCSRSAVPAVVQACHGQRLWLWVADWTGEPHMPQLELPADMHVAAVQYANGELYDSSAVYDRGWL